MRLKGLVCAMEMLRLGNDTDRVESCVRCDTLSDVDICHFELGKRYERFTVELLVFSVNELE